MTADPTDPDPAAQPAPYPEIVPNTSPEEAPQTDPAPGEADTGRPHDQA